MARLPDEVRIREGLRIPGREIELAYARSSGPGGQHVNKTASKVVLRWSLARSEALGEADRRWLETRLASRLTTDGELVVACETHRDQGRNVQEALERFAELLREALHRPKRRKKTRPSRAATRRRLDAKRRRGARKRERRRPPDE